MYERSGVRREVLIGNQKIEVDSKLEENVIRRLESSGYSGFWIKPRLGLNSGRYNYTPDLELAIYYKGKNRRALVEIKPMKSYFTSYISLRMRKVARFTSYILLLYLEDEKKWYVINRHNGRLTPIILPPHATLKQKNNNYILTQSAQSVYQHQYRKRINPLVVISKILILIIDDVQSTLFK